MAPTSHFLGGRTLRRALPLHLTVACYGIGIGVVTQFPATASATSHFLVDHRFGSPATTTTSTYSTSRLHAMALASALLPDSLPRHLLPHISSVAVRSGICCHPTSSAATRTGIHCPPTPSAAARSGVRCPPTFSAAVRSAVRCHLSSSAAARCGVFYDTHLHGALALTRSLPIPSQRAHAAACTLSSTPPPRRPCALAFAATQTLSAGLRSRIRCQHLLGGLVLRRVLPSPLLCLSGHALRCLLPHLLSGLALRHLLPLHLPNGCCLGAIQT